MFLQEYGKEIFSAVIALVVWGLGTFYKSRARLQVARPHAFSFLVQEPLFDTEGKKVSDTQIMHTASFWIENAGRETATNVEIIFNFEPSCFNTWPLRPYGIERMTDHRYVVKFSSLSPREVITCHIFNINTDLPDLMLVRCDQSVGTNIAMHPQPVVSGRRRRVLWALVALGAATTAYLAIILVQFLVLRTPFGH